MSKYKFKTLALLSAIPVLFTACTLQDIPLVGGFFGGKPLTPVELTMWGLWEKEDTLGPVLEEYKAAVPNASFVYEDMSVLKLNHLVEYKKRVFARMEQSTWDADIVMVHNSWVPRMIKSGFLEPMPSTSPIVAGYSEMFYPVATESAVSGGQVYGIPAYYDGLVLVYNKDHFEQIGQVNPPTAWEEFRRVAIDLTILSDDTADPQVIRAGAAVGAADNIGHFTDILGLMWAQAGVSIPDGIDSVPAQDALAFYISMMSEHNVWKKDFPEATTAFVNEQVSMIFVPSWQILDILAASPGMDIGVAPVPQALANSPVTWGSFWMYVVPKNSDASATAWNFLEFMSGEDAQKILYASAAGKRPFGAAYALTVLSSDLQNHEYLGSLVRTAPYARSAEIAGRSGNRVQEEELTKAINMILSEELTVEEALIAAKEAISF
jgi:ABC-type glycerol-3-phosphate transport system substrate-binding protein